MMGGDKIDMGGNHEDGHDRTLFDKKDIFLNGVKRGLWPT